jgi:uncharacterized protein YacL
MITKIFFFVLTAALGFWIAYPFHDLLIAAIFGCVIGASAFALVWGLESKMNEFTPKSMLGGGLGIVVASLSFFALRAVLESLRVPANITLYILPTVFLLLFYLGITIGVRKGFEIDQTTRKNYSKNNYRIPKILDTSVIIDGRIADVADAGFIEGIIIVPKFIIKELQYIADSADPIKRVRGRRGLDVLKRMQEIPNISIKITSHDFARVREADLKLVELAKSLRGIIITNDFNLNKVAGLHGVKVLNLNQLASAIKPIVLPGETMNIRVVKEGKEENQGVGYLEDGTMVVVDDARKYVGKEIEVSVTSVLQTPTGRMIFSRVKEDSLISDLHG